MSIAIERITTVGKVTSLNSNHFQFVIDNETIVYAGLWSFHNGNTLPCIGDTVKITTIHDHNARNCIILCDKSEVIFVGEPEPTKENEYQRVVQTHGLGTADIARVDKLHNTIKRQIEGICSVSPDLVTVAVISQVLQNKPRQNYSCENTTLGNRQISLKTVSQFRQVNTSNIVYVQLKFPYWTFGVHPQYSDPEFLLGYLCVSKVNGLLLLKDSKHKFACKIFNDGNVQHLLNRFVLIKNCYVFTEIFNVPKIPPMEVVAFHVDDAVALDLIPPMNGKQMGVCSHGSGKNSFAFDLMHKGNVCIGPKRKPQCCLLIKTTDQAEMFLVLDFNLLHVLPLLHPNRKYKLMHDMPLKTYDLCQRFHFMNKPTLIVDNSQSVFVENGLSDLPENLLTLEEAKAHVQGHNTMFSFSGWLHEKSFSRPQENFFANDLPKLPNMPFFGTPGKLTHVLYFMASDVKLTIFLNDFEANLLPIGLIPGMVLKVRYVLPQKNKYVKSTPLTTFEIVDYRPMVPFSSVNLCSRSWGLTKQYDSYLGLTESIPLLTLISARLCNVRITKATLTVTCANCNRSKTCACRGAVRNFSVDMFLSCRDELGTFGVTTTSIDTFKRLLRLNNFQFEVIVKALEETGCYVFNANEKLQDLRSEPGKFRYQLDCAIRYSSYQLHDVPIAARRFYTKDNKLVYFSFDIAL